MLRTNAYRGVSVETATSRPEEKKNCEKNDNEI